MNSPLELAIQAVSNAGYMNDVEPEELVEIMQHVDIPAAQMDKLAGTVVYINKRVLEKASRYVAFKTAFPKRCIPQEDANVPFPNTTGEVSRTAIEIKAKRLEQSNIYKKVFVLLQTNLYISYGLQRMGVLDKILERIHNDDISNRDLAPLAKTFLDATAKPEEAKGMEVNVNISDGEVSLKSFEEKLSDISNKLEGKSADEIIDVLALPTEVSNGDSSTSSLQ